MNYDSRQQDLRSDDQHLQLDSKTRWAIFGLLIICSLAVVCARIWEVRAVSQGVEVPFFSANDRSRWITIRSLGDHDTYAIDSVLAEPDGQAWDTIDKVLHWGSDSRPHFYSSKPPFLSTVLTYPYLAIKAVTGWDLQNDTFQVVRWMLVICQVVPLFLFLWSVGKCSELVAESEWTRFYLMGAAAFGTFVTTFAISINNHLPAVVGVSVALYALIKIWKQPESGAQWFLLCGLASAYAAACDLPALSFVVVAMALCCLRSFIKTLFAFLPPAALIAALFVWTNFNAHGNWEPAYAHRGDGQVLSLIDQVNVQALASGVVDQDLQQALLAARPGELDKDAFNEVQVVSGGWPEVDEGTKNRWLIFFGPRAEPSVLVERTDGAAFEIRQWKNWYEYPGSYWLADNDQNKSAVDLGESDPLRYLVNLTLWHHGVFTLTPIWFLSIFGVLTLCVSPTYRLRLLGISILSISVTVIAFYVVGRPAMDRNYGGLCCGPRWLFWLIPLWLVAMAPALDAISESRPMRFIALVLLVISIASSFYAWSNPWVHPWLYQWFGGI